MVAQSHCSQLTNELVESIILFSDKLPLDEVYDLRTLIRASIVRLPENFINVTKQNRNLDIIKGMIKVNSALNECKDYLEMAYKLKFADTHPIISQLDGVSKELNMFLSAKISH